MNAKEFLSKLESCRSLNFGNLITLGSWVENEALPWLWDELGGVIVKSNPSYTQSKKRSVAKRLQPMSEAEAVRSGLVMTLHDPKQFTPLYFQAQMTMLDAEARLYCGQIAKFACMGPAPYANAAARSLHAPLIDMMHEAYTMLERAGHSVTKVRGFYGAWSRQYEHPIEVFNGARQVIYDPYSNLAHSDRVPNMGTAVLRTAIELRLRHAFCIYHVVSTTKTPGAEPIAMNTLFEAIQLFEKDIQFGVNVHDVLKIYRWSNLYLHAGKRDFPWVPGFLIQYLRPLFGGPNHVDGGIEMKKATWHAVRKAVDDSYIPRTGKKKWKVAQCSENEAQCIII